MVRGEVTSFGWDYTKHQRVPYGWRTNIGKVQFLLLLPFANGKTSKPIPINMLHFSKWVFRSYNVRILNLLVFLPDISAVSSSSFYVFTKILLFSTSSSGCQHFSKDFYLICCGLKLKQWHGNSVLFLYITKSSFKVVRFRPQKWVQKLGWNKVKWQINVYVRACRIC